MEAQVAVVIATRNRRACLLATLRRLEALPERPPIVVVDNASTDGTPGAVARAHPQVELLALERNAGAAGRTAGIRRAGTPYVALADDDSWWAPGTLAHAAELFAGHPRLAVLAARILVGPEEREDPTCAEMARSPLTTELELPGRSVLGFLACGAIVRRAAYLEVGGFHGRLGVGGEETLLAIDLRRGGWGLAYVPALVAHHHPPHDRAEAERRRALARNELWTAWLRRPLRAAAGTTVGLGRRALHDRDARAGLIAGIRGLRPVIRDRRPVGRKLEGDLRLLTREHG